MAQGNSPTTRVMHATPAADRERIQIAINRVRRGLGPGSGDLGVLATAAALYLAVLPQEPAPPATDAPYSFWLGELHGENRRVLEHRALSHAFDAVRYAAGPRGTGWSGGAIVGGGIATRVPWSDYDPDGGAFVR